MYEKVDFFPFLRLAVCPVLEIQINVKYKLISETFFSTSVQLVFQKYEDWTLKTILDRKTFRAF